MAVADDPLDGERGLPAHVVATVDRVVAAPPLPSGSTLLFATVAGSHAYGTAHAESDVDVRGFYAVPMRTLLGLHDLKETVDRGEPDLVVHEVGKFAKLAVAANPNILEVLHGPDMHVHPAAQPLVDNRHLFLSQRLRRTYGGFAASQMRRVESGTGKMQPHKRAKHLLHTFRVLEQGTSTLRTGRLDVQVADVERLRALSRLDDGQVVAEFERQLAVFDATPSSLPEEPDVDAVNELLVDLRLRLDAR